MLATNLHKGSRFLGPQDATVRLDKPLAATSITQSRDPARQERRRPSKSSSPQNPTPRDWQQLQWRYFMQQKVLREKKRQKRNFWLVSALLVVVVPVILHGIRLNASVIRSELGQRIEVIHENFRNLF